MTQSPPIGKRPNLSFVLAVLILSLTPPVAGQTYPKTQTPEYSVSVTEATPCCPRQVVLSVTDKATGRARAMRLEGELRGLRDVFVVGAGRVALLGELDSEGMVFLIGDLAAGELEAEIQCRGFAFSPSGRFLVYTSYHRDNAPPENRRSIVLLYDLTRGPDENGRGTEAGRGGALGRPIYPARNALEDSLDPFLDAERPTVISPLVWSEDEGRIVFVDRDADGVVRLVLVDRTEGYEFPAIWRHRLDRSLTPPGSGDRQSRFGADGISGIAWQDERTVLLELSAGSEPPGTLEVKLP